MRFESIEQAMFYAFGTSTDVNNGFADCLKHLDEDKVIKIIIDLGKKYEENRLRPTPMIIEQIYERRYFNNTESQPQQKEHKSWSKEQEEREEQKFNQGFQTCVEVLTGENK